MKAIAQRVKLLRESMGISQLELAKKLKTTQSSVNRYENDQVNVPHDLLLKYADFFDVSLDYLYGRTDKPQGMSYEFKPKLTPEKEELKLFIEMCFDKKSPMNKKLKEALFEMVENGKED